MNNIPDHIMVYSTVAEEIKKLSKCSMLKVACIAVNQKGKFRASGVNGTPTGFENCCDKFGDSLEYPNSEHSEFSHLYEIHAEMNCIMDIQNVHEPLDLIVTHSPCDECLKHILAHHSIKNVYVNRLYFKTSEEKFKMQQKMFSDAAKGLYLL